MDNNANNYMLLQQRNVRIPLLAKNGTWKFTINKEKWEISDCMERLYAYHLIGSQDYKTTSATLRANYKHITPIQIEAFIQHFEKTHPVEEYQFNINEIPVYATEKNLLEIPTNQPYRVLLTPKQEQDVLDVIKNNTEGDGRKSVNRWFRQYVNRYALTPRNKNQEFTHYKNLAEWFCEQHGVKYEALYNIEKVRKEKEEELKRQATVNSEIALHGCLYMVLSIVGVVLFLYLILCSIWDEWVFFN